MLYLRRLLSSDEKKRRSLCTLESRSVAARPHVIGLDIDGATVWIWRDAPAAMVTAIIDALKARS